MKSPLHQLSIISRFGEVEMCPQKKAGLVWGRVGVGGWGGQLRLSPAFRCVCGIVVLGHPAAWGLHSALRLAFPSLIPIWPQLRPQPKGKY